MKKFLDLLDLLEIQLFLMSKCHEHGSIKVQFYKTRFSYHSSSYSKTILAELSVDDYFYMVDHMHEHSVSFMQLS